MYVGWSLSSNVMEKARKCETRETLAPSAASFPLTKGLLIIPFFFVKLKLNSWSAELKSQRSSSVHLVFFPGNFEIVHMLLISPLHCLIGNSE